MNATTETARRKHILISEDAHKQVDAKRRARGITFLRVGDEMADLWLAKNSATPKKARTK